MSAPAGDGNKLISISFTALLYGVVIDATLHRLHHLALTPANLLLILALVLVIQDFFFYDQDMKRLNLEFAREVHRHEADTPARVRAEKDRRRKEHKIFVFDVLVLSSWYALSLAAHATLTAYLVCLTLFFGSVALWDTFACPPTTGKAFRRWVREGKLAGWLLRSPWPMVVVSAGAAIMASRVLEAPAHGSGDVYRSFDEWTTEAWLLLGVPAGLFFLWRVGYWVAANRRAEQEIEPSIDLIAPVPDTATRLKHLDLFVREKFVEISGRVDGLTQAVTARPRG